MPFAYWCVLIAALMPLALVSYAKFGSYDNTIRATTSASCRT